MRPRIIANQIWQRTQPYRRAILERIPVVAWERLAPKDVLCFNYHLVSDTIRPHSHFLVGKSPAMFERDVLWAKKHLGFMDYHQLYRLRTGFKSTPENRALVTFDDGFAECYTTARPILLREGAPAIFFVTTDWIDNGSMFYEGKIALCLSELAKLGHETLKELNLLPTLKARPVRDGANPLTATVRRSALQLEHSSSEFWSLVSVLVSLSDQDEPIIDWLCDELQIDTQSYLQSARPFLTSSQIRQLHSDGFTIGAHGRAHRNMNGMTPRELEAEILTAATSIREVTGQASVPFAFPYYGAEIDRRLLVDISSRNPRVGLFFDTGGLRTDHPNVINRIGADSPEGASAHKSNLPSMLRRNWSFRTSWNR
jgi:peptidoglycan/xylan/chitin deacetylase (PgdA/CDA1 family)